MDKENTRPTFYHVKMEITDELRREVREYHEFHGDTSCKIIKVVRDEDGYPALLVRVRNAAREKYSCIDSAAGGYISETASCPREDEAAMVEWFAGEKDGGDYY